MEEKNAYSFPSFLCLARLPFVVLGIILYELEMKLICGGGGLESGPLYSPCNVIDIRL